MKYTNTIIIFIIIIGHYSITAQNIVNIKWKDIKKVEGKIELQKVKIWGEDPNNINELFTEPVSIAVDKSGRTFILDRAQNKIFVYDKKYNLIKTLGGKGSGPGEFQYALAMGIDENDNIIVTDRENQRFHIYNKIYTNKTLKIAEFLPSRFFASENKIYFHSMNPNSKTKPELHIYNYDGKKVGELGQIPESNIKKGSTYYDHVIASVIDKNKNIYVANIFLRPQIRCYSVDGKLNMIINYDLPYRPLEIKITPTESRNTWQILKSMAVDSEGRIFIIVQRRLPTEKEMKYSIGYTSSSNIRRPKKVENTIDWYQLIVFDKNGNLLASKQLDQYAADLFIFNDCLYLIDGYYKSQIYQYKYSLK